MTRFVRHAAAFGAALLAATAAAADPTTWTVDHFEVVQAEPFSSDAWFEDDVARIAQKFGWDTMDFVDVSPPLTPQMKVSAEAFLHEAAKRMQEWGFPEPRLTDVVTRADGQKAYRVYYTTIPDAAGLYDAVDPDHPFTPDYPAIFVDAEAITDANGVTPKGYQTLAHELFHAVQFNMACFRSGPCENTWLREGQARAVGYDLVHLLMPATFDNANTTEAWGGRDYSHTLFVAPTRGDPHPRSGYLTSSFWRYLAEVEFLKTNATTEVYPSEFVGGVDYSYLAHFLSNSTNETGEGGELRWLDAMVRGYKNMRVPLRDYFAEFLVSYAAYGEARVPETTGQGVPDRHWRVGVFHQIDPVNGYDGVDGCWKTEVRPDARKAGVPFKIRKNAGACIELAVSGFEGETPVTVSLNALDKKGLSQLRIGVAGELRTAKTQWTADYEDLSRTRHNYRVVSGDTTTFVVANMASDPSTTKELIAGVTFVVGGAVIEGASNETGGDFVGPMPPDASPEDETRARMARAAKRVTSNGPMAAMVNRREKRDEMVIRLGAVPDAANVLGEVNESGSGAGVMIGMDDAMKEAQARMSEIMGATTAIAEGDSTNVLLTIPLIDFGFTGTFDKAEIKLTRQPERDLHAVDPRDNKDPNGTVTIDEYTPDFMSGSFSGQLVDKYEDVDRGQPLTIVRNISGEFWVAAPWFGDDRFEPDPVDTLEEDIAADLVSRMPGILTTGMDEALGGDPDPAPGAGPSPGGPGGPPDASGGVVRPECDCSCEGYAKVEDLSERADEPGFSPTPEDNALMACTMQCMGQYAACVR